MLAFTLGMLFWYEATSHIGEQITFMSKKVSTCISYIPIYPNDGFIRSLLLVESAILNIHHVSKHHVPVYSTFSPFILHQCHQNCWANIPTWLKQVEAKLDPFPPYQWLSFTCSGMGEKNWFTTWTDPRIWVDVWNPSHFQMLQLVTGLPGRSSKSPLNLSHWSSWNHAKKKQVTINPISIHIPYATPGAGI